MSKILLDSQHLVSFKSELDRGKKKKIIPEGTILNLKEEKKKMTQFISSVIKHPPLSYSNTANGQFIFLQFCISLCSKETLKAKMLGFYVPKMMPSKAALTFLTL